MKSDQPRFLADSMLGSLAKKLRLLGLDTAYLGGADPSEIRYVVRSQDRILLTRNRALAGELGDRSWLVQGRDVREEFTSVAPKLSNAACSPRPFTRCLDCNGLLEPLSPYRARGKVPPYILESREGFSRCRDCEKVFWEGTHRERMGEEVEWMEGILKGEGRRQDL